MRTSTFRALTVATVLLTYGTFLMGGYVRGSFSGLGCDDQDGRFTAADWPLCRGQLFPDWSDDQMTIEWLHRWFAMLAGVSILACAAIAWMRFRPDRRVLAAATFAGVLLPVQGDLGRRVVQHDLSPALSALHMGVASALFGAVVALAIFAWQRHERAARADAVLDAASGPPSAPAAARGPRTRASVAAYVHLLRPRMHALLVLAALLPMTIAAGGAVSLSDAAVVAVGGSLAIGGASALNAYVERGTDAAMARTRSRLLPTGDVPPGHALALGLATVFSGVVAMGAFVNLLAATLTLGAAAYYLFVYTVLLKPNTHHNTVLGGIAGAAPPLVGWAAATGGVSWAALGLAGVVFAWQPAHFWAFSLKHRNDYARAGIPMLPVVKGPAATRRAILNWTLWTMVAAAALVAPLGLFGPFYFVASTALGLAFLGFALAVRFTESDRVAMAMFYASIAYLALLFVAMTVDRLAF